MFHFLLQYLENSEKPLKLIPVEGGKNSMGEVTTYLVFAVNWGTLQEN